MAEGTVTRPRAIAPNLCTKAPLHGATQAGLPSQGLSAAQGGTPMLSSLQVGAELFPPPRPGLPLSHCFPDSFAKPINTTKNNFCLAPKRSQQQGCSPPWQGRGRMGTTVPCEGWSPPSGSPTGCPFQICLPRETPPGPAGSRQGVK